MDTVRFVMQCLSQVQLRMLATCEGLTQEQVLWRPAPHANNIGFILWHVARAEDGMASGLKGDATPLWNSEGWYKKFGQPEKSPDPGDRMGLRTLPIPDLDILIGYLKSAHEQALDYCSTVILGDLSRAPDSTQPERTVADVLRHMITHKNNHHGQIDFIRGLQDTSWDLPPGTGVVLPS